MTPEQFMGGVAFFILLFGFFFGMWKYVDGKLVGLRSDVTSAINAAATLAALARQELADHKLHAAETFMTKLDMRESTEQIMNAISAVKTSIDGTNQRIDRMYEPKPVRRSS